MRSVKYNGRVLTAANISTVRHTSPFRYPGGKSWLTPQIRQWITARSAGDLELVEPFAGGGSISLFALLEGLVPRSTMIERDAAVAALWKVVLNGQGTRLARRVRTFELSDESIRKLLGRKEKSDFGLAFQTLVRNRVSRNGILAPGAGLLKQGESGKGLSSRWYPDTLANRIVDITEIKTKITFIQGDGVEFIEADRKSNRLYFVDPPYMNVGKRLYRHGDIDHRRLYEGLAALKGDFLLTYNFASEARHLAREFKFETRIIEMRCGQNKTKKELLIARDLSWLGTNNHKD
jgi:DNA adenine methylase